MRIALVHSFYASNQPSGETGIVHAEHQALLRAGFDARLFAAHTDNRQEQSFYRLRSGLRVATGRGQNPLRAIRQFQPHLVHVHNLFPNIGRKWTLSIPVPVVHTLHNYRPICAAGTLFRDGNVCTLCPDGARWAGLKYACYRGSRLATAPISWANRRGPDQDPLLRCASRLLLAEPAIEIYKRAGLDPEKMIPWPNFLPVELDPGPLGHSGERQGFLYVGRLSDEKGIERLIERWPVEHELTVVGDGPRHDHVKTAVRDHRSIRFLGPRSREEVLALMAEGVALIVPSLWFEMSPRVYPEALAAGLSVLAFHPNSVAHFVENDATGKAVAWDDDLRAHLDDLAMRGEKLSTHCRQVFESKYSEHVHLRRVRALYEEVVAMSSSDSWV